MEVTNAKILIVDDEKDIIEFLKYNFEKEGFKVFTARNGNEGKQVAKKEKPDLIILDIMMPGMDGVELCQDLRALPDPSWIGNRDADLSEKPRSGPPFGR